MLIFQFPNLKAQWNKVILGSIILNSLWAGVLDTPVLVAWEAEGGGHRKLETSLGYVEFQASWDLHSESLSQNP